jgi:hypothetical protein
MIVDATPAVFKTVGGLWKSQLLPNASKSDFARASSNKGVSQVLAEA